MFSTKKESNKIIGWGREEGRMTYEAHFALDFLLVFTTSVTENPSEKKNCESRAKECTSALCACFLISK
jgi:hypothetical protein